MLCEEVTAWILEAKRPPLQVMGAPGQILYPASGFEASLFETVLEVSVCGCTALGKP